MSRSSVKYVLIICGFVIACVFLFFALYKTPFASSKPHSVVQQVHLKPHHAKIVVKEGDTFGDLLKTLPIASQQAQEATDALSKVFDPSDLKVDQEIRAVCHPQGPGQDHTLTSLYLRPAIDYAIKVYRTPEGACVAKRQVIPLKHEYVHIGGKIEGSLYGDALQKGASPKMLHEMIKAFSYDVDFQRDIQPGTAFSLFYDSRRDPQSTLERPGNLLYARLVIGGTPHEIYWFKPTGGVGGYYTAKGQSIKTALLRTPIDGARLSSGFGNRKHPVLGYTKMHKGVDFAAPTGTPIMAAGDGVVERRGPYSSYGHYICIRHGGNMKTAYAHLSRYAKNIKAGIKVRQGQIIGYVGRTGRATGPHLHFELLQNGKHINPQKITQLPKTALQGKTLVAFKRFKEKIDKMRQK